MAEAHPGASLARLCIAACSGTSLVVAMDGVIIHSNVAIFCPRYYGVCRRPTSHPRLLRSDVLVDYSHSYTCTSLSREADSEIQSCRISRSDSG
jgi:hypothetical protein